MRKICLEYRHVFLKEGEGNCSIVLIQKTREWLAQGKRPSDFIWNLHNGSDGTACCNLSFRVQLSIEGVDIYSSIHAPITYMKEVQKVLQSLNQENGLERREMIEAPPFCSFALLLLKLEFCLTVLFLIFDIQNEEHRHHHKSLCLGSLTRMFVLSAPLSYGYACCCVLWK